MTFSLLWQVCSGNVQKCFGSNIAKTHKLINHPLCSKDIAWESKVHIRHANTNGGWVHSMPGEYARDGTIDQAIQLVEWDDDLTCWHLFTPNNAIREQYLKNREDRNANPAVAFNGYIFDGDMVRLRHCYSKVALAVHNMESIGSNKSFIREMRGIKWDREAPAPESIWRVELVPDGLVPGLADGYRASDVSREGEPIEKVGGRNTHPSKQWHSIKGFRLYNEHLNCYLHSHKVFRAPYSTYQEVGCIQGDRQKTNTYFVIDKNVNPHCKYLRFAVVQVNLQKRLTIYVDSFTYISACLDQVSIV